MNFTEFILSGSLYDGMWALAMGLHNASDLLSRNDSSGCDHLPGQLMALEDFDYQNERMGCVLRKGFSQVHFSGITVRLLLYIDISIMQPSHLFTISLSFLPPSLSLFLSLSLSLFSLSFSFLSLFRVIFHSTSTVVELNAQFEFNNIM